MLLIFDQISYYRLSKYTNAQLCEIAYLIHIPLTFLSYLKASNHVVGTDTGASETPRTISMWTDDLRTEVLNRELTT